MPEIKIFLSRRCRHCIPVKHWLDANPRFNQYVFYEPPSTTVPRLPYVIIDGKAYKKVSEMIAALDQIKQTA